MSNRTVIVDNNTWNNTHIATVAKALISDEDEAYRISKHLDAKYVLVVFGGYINYNSDDYAKFLWFVRIAASEYTGIDETAYYKNGRFNPSEDGLSEKMYNSLAFKCMYYRFNEIHTQHGKKPGFDRARWKQTSFKDIQFKHFREVYTSQLWMVRVFEVLDEPNRGPEFTEPPNRKFFI